MTIKTTLLSGAALGVLLATASGLGAEAKTRHHHTEAAKVEGPSVQSEIAELRAEVEALKARDDARSASQAQTQAQLAAVQAQLADTQALAATQQAKLDEQIQTIPATVDTRVASLLPKTDKLYIKGVTLAFGGFVAAESVSRSRNEQADVASSFSGIPFPNSTLGRTSETRLTARQSRFTGLIQGQIDPTLLASAYAEVDFLGAAQTANSNETNSYTPRMRVFYTTLDKETSFGGLHLLAGQSWSLATLNGKGISPRNEVTPPVIDAQYVPGFVFTRQPQVRLAADFDNTFWFAASVENPQTTYFNNGVYLPTVAPNQPITVFTNGAAGSGFNSANTLSLNRFPDVIAKVAFEKNISGHQFHLEGFGIYRDFYARINQGSGPFNTDVAGGGVGGGMTLQLVPKVLDIQASGLIGRGVGRYGASQLPDVTIGLDGALHPVAEDAVLFGGTFHYGKALDIYVLGGEERERQTSYTVGTAFNGLGNPAYNNRGCETEGGSCSGNTHYVDQITGGFWDRPYVGKFGRVQFGMQYSYTERHAFPGYGTVAGAGGNPAPIARENMILTSIRYYPF
jgi:multidrug efflux pump subunit AcrA (membrane-fusion protein)